MELGTNTIVGFVADFPTQTTSNSPAGKELADFVFSNLTNHSWEIAKPSNHEGWAWTWHCKVDEVQIETIVGFVDDMETLPPRQWLIANDFKVPLLKKMFLGKSVTDKVEALATKYCNDIHSAITNDGRFSDVYWYNSSSFDQPGDVPKSAP